MDGAGMSQQKQVDPQTYVPTPTHDLDAHDSADLASFDALIAEARELRERADQLSKKAQMIITENLVVREIWERRG